MKISAITCAALLALTALSSQATVVTMNAGPAYSASYDNGGMGGGRGVGLKANQAFNMTALAIDLSVTQAQSGFKFDIYGSSDGHTAGALLASTMFNLSSGQGYQDQSFNFAFNAGSYYVLNFARVDNAWLGTNLGTHYSWEGSYTPYNYGAFTLVEGFEGATPNNSNPLVPWMRVTGNDGTVPEPASMALVGFALLAAYAGSRKRKQG